MDGNGGGLWSRILAVPILALFLAVAILAGRMALDWTPKLSEQVVGGALTACGGGIALFGVAAGGIVGLAFYRRMERGKEEQGPGPGPYYPGQGRQLPGARSQYYLPPPTVTGAPTVDAPQGSWSSPGPAVYRHPADVDYDQEEIEPAQW